MNTRVFLLSVAVWLGAAWPPVLAQSPTPTPVRFGVIGDFGLAGSPERTVAVRVKSWNPDFILTVGDNNYEFGGADTIDANIGQYYHDFIAPYSGAYGPGAAANRFFPTLGNHDWKAPGAQPYLDYFALPDNERYYDFVQGPVHFFAVDADPHEPDGTTFNSVQGQWLQSRLAAATAPWKVVYFHQPPYSSGPHGPSAWMQWPFREWGASIVLCGHEHFYERLEVDGLPYIINGLGGRNEYALLAPAPGSQVRFNADFGAVLAEADARRLTFQFITRAGIVVDTYTLGHVIGQVARLSVSGGAGVAGVTVTATGNGRSVTAVTAAAGRYILPPLPGGDYTLTPSRDGFVFNPAVASVTVDAAGAPAVNFTALQPPVVSGITPAAGSIGGTVTLSGLHFSGATAVRFSGVGAVFMVHTDTQITAIVPPGATSGPVSVATPDGAAASPNAFSVVADTIPPQVAITVPAADAAVAGLFSVSGTAADNPGGVGLSRVLLYLRRNADGQWWQGANWGAPRTPLATLLNGASWQRTGGLPDAVAMPAGAYALSAYAYDRAKHSKAISRRIFSGPPDLTGPAVAITAPANGAVVSALPPFSGTAQDNSGGVGLERVTLILKRHNDGACWNGMAWGAAQTALATTLNGTAWVRATGLPGGADLPNGAYTLFAFAYDWAGNRTRASAGITVNAPSR